MAELNSHAHGRWIGLFKLAEECGELVVAAIDLGDRLAEPEFLRAFEDEIADANAACGHAIAANLLDQERIASRIERQVIQLNHDLDIAAAWPGRDILIRRTGVLVQLLGKIAAFPNGTEHPDGYGNLVGRLEVAIADHVAAAAVVVGASGLDQARLDARADAKLPLFRQWFPAPAGAQVAA